ncbi:MAG: nicotinate-nicotinamide nucleotide adenylyltransferase [Erysipelotrichaceae bacterium]|nr:nicotinate-nicotinamide nucleotide adenylyltransferase [Erysipelotrichaceae bacterium]
MTKKIILVPGTFNPITNAHIKMGINGKATINADEVIYIPSKDSFLNSWKEMSSNSIMPSALRIKLIEEAVKPYGFKVSDIEAKEIVSGKTYDTANYFKKENPDSEIYLMFGLDNLFDIDRWYRSEELIKENNFLIVGRYNKAIPEEIANQERFKNKLHFVVNDDFNDISSTIIRNAYLNNEIETIKDKVPNNVYEYLLNTKEVYK